MASEVDQIKKRCRAGNKGMMEAGVKLYACPICQKTFVVYSEDEWVYKRSIYRRNKENEGLFLCSYGCLRKYDQIFEKPPKKLEYEE